MPTTTGQGFNTRKSIWGKSLPVEGRGKSLRELLLDCFGPHADARKELRDAHGSGTSFFGVDVHLRVHYVFHANELAIDPEVSASKHKIVCVLLMRRREVNSRPD